MTQQWYVEVKVVAPKRKRQRRRDSCVKRKSTLTHKNARVAVDILVRTTLNRLGPKRNVKALHAITMPTILANEKFIETKLVLTELIRGIGENATTANKGEAPTKGIGKRKIARERKAVAEKE
jgi:hypothetical protein